MNHIWDTDGRKTPIIYYGCAVFWSAVCVLCCDYSFTSQNEEGKMTLKGIFEIYQEIYQWQNYFFCCFKLTGIDSREMW
jgi:hypothetical protein